MSDLARQYAPGKEPGSVLGSAAANAAGSGIPQPAGKEITTVANAHNAHDYKDDRSR